MRAFLFRILRWLYRRLRALTLRLLGIAEAEAAPTALKNEDGLVDDKHYEFPFVLESLRWIEAHHGPVRDVCDVGGADSVLTPMLAALGYAVTSCDIRPWHLTRPNFRHVVDDIKHSRLATASFDVIVAVSSLEHVGLGGRYGETDDPHGDRAAVREIHRLLRPGGYFILTVPYGRSRTLFYADGQDPKWKFALGRVYGRQEYARLIEGFEVVRQAFYGPPEAAGAPAAPNVRFAECGEGDAQAIEPGMRRHVIACALLRRRPTIGD